MADDLILHYAPDNASLCVRLALEEAGLPYQTRLVDRKNKAQRAAAYLKLNPNGLIPVLETPDGPIYETAAILLWVAAQTPGTIFPTPSASAYGAAVTRLIWMSNTLHVTERMLFYPENYAPAAPDQVRGQARLRIGQLMDQMTSDPAQLCTERPDILACYLAPLLRWPALYGGETSWFSLVQWPALFDFARDFEKRPAVVRATLAEGLGPTPFSAPQKPTPPEGSAT